MLSASVIVSFHYCGGNIDVGKIGLAIRGPVRTLYVDWVGDGNAGMVKNRRTHAIWTREKLHSKREERRGEHNSSPSN